MTPAKAARLCGLESLAQACRLSGESRKFYTDLFRRKPATFGAIMIGLSMKREYDRYLKELTKTPEERRL